MQIYRAPYSGGSWNFTDSKTPPDYLDYWDPWDPDNKIVLDGTIDKGGERHTALGLQIGEDDVVALFNTLVTKYRDYNRNLHDKVAELENEAHTLKTALRKIYSLVSIYSYKAPNKDELIAAVKTIAEHYYFPSEGTDHPEIEWIDWDSI